MVMNECVGPRCVRKRNKRSISGRTEAESKRGRFTLTLASFDEPFPNMYPNAKWPIANVQKTS